MKLALTGLARSGKTTLFAALSSRHQATGRKREESNLAFLPAPDERVDRLAAIYKPKKATYAVITYLDPAPPMVKPDDPATRLSPELRQVDGLVEVIRNFDGGMGAPQPEADRQAFSDELILNDLLAVENRLERMTHEKKRGRKEDPEEAGLLEEIRTLLSQERPLKASPELASHVKLRGFGFLTAKPVVLIANNEDDDPDPPPLKGEETPVVIRARIEAELAELDAEERDEFAAELGIEGNALDRLITASFRSLDMITFYTANQNEVRAWTVKRGATAIEAAGAVHSDMVRGFIRAEVMRSEDLYAQGSEAAVKKAGLMRLVGRDQVVEDHDVLYIRFNV
ncbi:MAG: redox-regulated ATPase YchF [Deltaproteobacteria bacterium]|nr:redox-regulated ATPase YchF [Deltaproteobacteria bacterium]MBW2085972.1 redox-regulated ATPase YchF [Deltaproteobacteria bacterium]